jgi:peptidoglycan/xylan/chitin deacetylase (PgdA/CDA1 family)/SAM-dependent methyltransferase
MSDLVVRLEMASGELIRRHRAQLADRDRELAELERIRAETAHHRAYIAHHGDPAIDWGDLRRLDPVSRDWGYDRGIPIDRRYIDDFLSSSSSDIRGAVLEVQEDDFTRRFGGPRVTRSDVVDLDDSNRRATIVADLRDAVGLQEAEFDCIILTQTLHVIDDATAVVRECFRLLRPGGVLLATLPSASRVCLEYGEAGDFWRATPAGARALFEPVFGADNVEIRTLGNVLTNVAFLHGLGCRELTDEEFERTDPFHPLLVGVRAQKPKQAPSRRRGHTATGVVLLYHRVDDRSDVHDLCVPPSVFEAQLSWLARECAVMPLEQLLAGARDGLPDRAVAITFDDGYLDTLQTALPLVERFGVPATVFATTRWLEEPGEYWWDALERALLSDDTPASLAMALDGAPVTFATGTPSERRTAHDRLHDCLVHATLAERDRAIAHIAQWSSLVPETRRRPLLADELRRLAAAPGISIGAHTINHLALPDQSPEVQHTEVLESLRALEHVVGRRVDLLAHPYGAVDRATADLVRQNCRWSAGCEALGLGPSFDAAAFPRLEVKRWDVPKLVENLVCRGFRP